MTAVAPTKISARGAQARFAPRTSRRGRPRSGVPVDVDRAQLQRAAAVRREVRPLRWLLLGLPVWWALGVGTLAFPATAAVLAAQMLWRRTPLRGPKGFGLWLAFLVWVAVSAVALSWSSLPLAYLWRAAQYLSATTIAVWIYVTPRHRLTAEAVTETLARFWLVVVGAGWLGVIWPRVQFTSPFERLLPGLASNSFFRDLSHPSLAQVQAFLGFPIGRPNAPFAYTNDWGAAYAICAPFFLSRWVFSADPARRRHGRVLLALSLVPAIVSLNRGMGLSLLVGLLSASFRRDAVGPVARRALGLIVVTFAVAALLTPLGDLVADRSANPHSNAGRSALYAESIRFANQRPIIGAGGPVAYVGDRLLPALGTQGQLWTVLVGQGYVGLGFFLGALFWFTKDTWRGPEVTRWCNVALLIAIVQLPVYDGLPFPVIAMLLVAALGARERRAASEAIESNDAAEPAGPAGPRQPATAARRTARLAELPA
ncbi:MAG: hypothetical protein HYX34_15340 [Actinobacteria bacterium]|nr:hypothetical protein [Actinomycetota bacterium]